MIPRQVKNAGMNHDNGSRNASAAITSPPANQIFPARLCVSHREAIRKFGRFPHRNAALGRVNTPEEQAWLDAGGGW